MPLEAPYDPVTITPLQAAFPADALDYMPSWETVEDWSKGRGWPLELQRDWMYRGIADIQLIPNDESWQQEDIDRAFAHLAAIQGSFAPKHEHKEAAVAFLIDQWFAYARWKTESEGEWLGHFPSDPDTDERQDDNEA